MTKTAEELSREILDFLDRHAGTTPDYDPDYDDAEARFTGPDSAMMYSAALALANGESPIPPLSSWGSGCYRPYGDSQAREEHDRLLKDVAAFSRQPLGPKR